ncbi:11149_t:CDS:2 [Entrophospora sp. SA101]|nr:11149_t:CDS:2 [Entrophospora sp. SA101]
METKCHVGKACVFDVVEKLKWGVSLKTHSIKEVIEKILTLWNVTYNFALPECKHEHECEDCGLWNYKPKINNKYFSNSTKNNDDELRNVDHITLSSINYERDIEISENIKYQQLAIVAKRNILKGEIIFQEIAFVSVHESSSLKCDYCHVPLNHSSKITCENSSCSDIFCTKSCNNLALQLNHSPLCGNILYYSFKNKLYNLLQIGVINNIVYFEILLMLKLFSIAKTRDVCPLDIQEIKYLSRFNRQISSSNVNINNKINQKEIEFPERIFELYQDILEILQISIHDLQYDFWIFLTIWSIIKSNLIQLNPTFQNEVVGIFTVSGLLNHSCTNANVKVRNFGLGLSETKLGYGIIIETTMDIMKDQELFLSYCDMSKIPKDRKKSYLLRYFGFECRCSDCQQY